jgi:hypothetical protein
MRVNRFVFLNLPILSLGDHLGVTVSPQSPFPTGYVTLSVDDRSPPLRLVPLHSKEQGKSFPPFLMHSRHTHPGPSGSRRTIGNIRHPYSVGYIDFELSIQRVVSNERRLATISTRAAFIANLRCNPRQVGQPCHTVLRAGFASIAQIIMPLSAHA